MSLETTARIAALNDLLRQQHVGGRILLSRGVVALKRPSVQAVLNAVAAVTKFTADNDPYGERDFGHVQVDGRSIFWKIDYYDQTYTHQAVDPSDERACCRVMCLMLSEEY